MIKKQLIDFELTYFLQLFLFILLFNIYLLGF